MADHSHVEVVIAAGQGIVHTQVAHLMVLEVEVEVEATDPASLAVEVAVLACLLVGIGQCVVGTVGGTGFAVLR